MKDQDCIEIQELLDHTKLLLARLQEQYEQLFRMTHEAILHHATKNKIAQKIGEDKTSVQTVPIFQNVFGALCCSLANENEKILTIIGKN